MSDDDRVSLNPLKPAQALKALLSVDPEDQEASGQEQCPKTWEGKRCSLQAGHLGPCRYDIPPP
jgi:hypothetical protein